MFFEQAKAAIINFKAAEIFRRLRQAFKFSEAWLSLHGCNKKIISIAMLAGALFY
jgi:hypothetical protein